MVWHFVCTYCGQVVFIFPGVVNAFRLSPGRGEMGFCWKGLGDEPLSIFRSAITSLPIRLQFPALGCSRQMTHGKGRGAKDFAWDP